MKIKRFFAPDIRQAIRMVREEQGPDAVILSNRKVDGGVEIVAARDFDEQLLEKKLKDPNDESKEKTGVKPSPSFSRMAGAGRGNPYSALGKNEERMGQDNTISPETETNSDVEVDQLSLGQATSVGQQAENLKATLEKTLAKKYEDSSQAEVSSSRSSNELELLRREMREMKNLMNVRLSEFAWHATADSNPVRVELLRRLSICGFARKTAFQLVDALPHYDDLELAWKQLHVELRNALPYHNESILERGGVVALVGPTGVGKTTTIAKLAARFRLSHGPREIALISTDNYRIAAHEQLTTYARILDIPIRAAHDAESLRQALNYFIDKRLVLIDTAGVGPHDERLSQQFSVLQDLNVKLSAYLVVSATTQQKGMEDILKAFSGYRPVASILTKLDEAATPASALSLLMENHMPLAFITDGQQVPEDLHTESGFDLTGASLSPGTVASGETSTSGSEFEYEQWVAYGYV